MKIIILAAGKGERLLPLTKNTPKPLLDMGNGATLLEEQIKRIQASGVIDEIVLVVGYLAEQIEAKIRSHQKNGLKIKTIYNPFFEITNNLVSLWLARHVMDTSFMVTNGDNLFADEVFSGLAEEGAEGVTLSLNVKEDYDDDDMKVTVEGDSVALVSKDIPLGNIQAESPGLALIRGEKPCRIFKGYLDECLRDRNNLSTYWLEIFNVLHRKGVPVKPWYFDATDKWQEVDFHMDLNMVRDLLQLKF